MPKPDRRDADKERYWRRILRRWQRSGLTGREFCAEYRLSEPSFYSWRREIARRDQGQAAAPNPTATKRVIRPVTERRSVGAVVPTFMRMTIDGGVSVPSVIEVVVADRRVLRVRPGFDADLLRQLVRLLEEPAC